MRVNARRHYRYYGTTNELVGCILMSAVIAGIVIGIGGGIISMLSSSDAYTRCIVTHSHDTCAYSLR